MNLKNAATSAKVRRRVAFDEIEKLISSDERIEQPGGAMPWSEVSSIERQVDLLEQLKLEIYKQRQTS